MVSTSTKFIVNKQTLNLFPLAGIKHSIKDPFPLARKTAFAVRNKKNGRKFIYTNSRIQELCPPEGKSSK